MSGVTELDVLRALLDGWHPGTIAKFCSHNATSYHTILDLAESLQGVISVLKSAQTTVKKLATREAAVAATRRRDMAQPTKVTIASTPGLLNDTDIAFLNDLLKESMLNDRMKRLLFVQAVCDFDYAPWRLSDYITKGTIDIGQEKNHGDEEHIYGRLGLAGRWLCAVYAVGTEMSPDHVKMIRCFADPTLEFVGGDRVYQFKEGGPIPAVSVGGAPPGAEHILEALKAASENDSSISVDVPPGFEDGLDEAQKRHGKRISARAHAREILSRLYAAAADAKHAEHEERHRKYEKLQATPPNLPETPFVAQYSACANPVTGMVFSTCTWTKDVPTLLPAKADYVTLVNLEEEIMYPFVPMADLVRECSLPEATGNPPYRLAEDWPTPDKLAILLAKRPADVLVLRPTRE